METIPVILVVDDEEQIGALTALFLAEAGFHARHVRSGAEALRFFAHLKDHVQLVITDWVMPDLFGDQLVTRLLEEKPLLKVIFISGNPIHSVDAPILLKEGVNFLQKPFPFPELIDMVKRALNKNELEE